MNSTRAIVVFCGALMAISGFSTDVMLPAFVQMTVRLKAEMELVQGTIPAFTFGFALSQIFWGPASDRFGRKPLLAAGLVVFLIGSLLCAIAPTIELVLAGRVIQGIGAASGPVIARAIMRDTLSGAALAQGMAFAMTIFSLGPIVAPLIGYGLVTVGDWRLIFVAMAAAGGLLLLINIGYFPESNKSPDPYALQPRRLLLRSRELLGNSQSRWFLFLTCFSYCALLSFVSNASRIYKESLGASEFEFALFFSICGLGIILGQMLNRRAMQDLNILTVLRIAGFVLFAASALVTLFALANILNSLWFTVLMFAFNTSFLVVVSNSLSLIIDPHPRMAGFVSAFFGLATLGISSIFVTATFSLFGGDAFRWGIGMSVLTGLALAGFLFTRMSEVHLTNQ